MLSKKIYMLAVLMLSQIGLTTACGQESLDDRIKAFEKKYGIDIVLEGHVFKPKKTKIGGADSKFARRYVPLFMSEFSLYAPEFVKKTGVKKIVVCKELSYDKQLRAAVPGLGTDIMYFDAEHGAEVEMYHRSAIHHEFFHLIDWLDDGKLYADEAWTKLNPEGFKYGRGGVHVQDDNTQGITYDRLGFMNKYSTQGVEEDKAEIFAYLVSESELMAKRVKTDHVVAAKVNMMKQLMSSYSKTIDDAFWENTALVQRDAGIGLAVMKMDHEAKLVGRSLKSNVAKAFLGSSRFLPAIEPYERYYKYPADVKKKGALSRIEGLSKLQWAALSESEQAEYEPAEINESQYYNTKFGSPVAFSRALDLVGEAGLDSLEGKKIVDFGFGTIGHLKMMASLGADVTGIEVDLGLKGMYSRESDTGTIPVVGESKSDGQIQLVFGQFPGDEALADKVGGDIDVFFSKNTLKRGFIHPAQEVDPKRQIRLGVTDAEFVEQVYRRLKPGGFFMIFNFHPRRTEPGPKYIPWSDGRSPFSKKDLTAAGFEIIAFDQDDTKKAHVIAKRMGWGSMGDLDEVFRATYTLMQKPELNSK